MIFLGNTFWSDGESVSQTIVNSENIKNVRLNNGYIDEVYLSHNTTYSMDVIPQEWGFDTIFHAFFKNTLGAGNVDYLATEITALRLKRREAGTYEWLTIAEFPVNSIEDLTISYIDKYVPMGDTVEYMLVAMINNIESTFAISTAESIYDGIVISEKDETYRAFVYEYVPTERNQQTAVITTLKGKYPYVIRNGESNYTSGQVHAGFFPLDGCELDMEFLMSTEYREKLTDFLTNGKPKLLKLDDGRSWIVSIIDNIVHSEDGGILYTDFSFVQTGNALDTEDLYEADLINVNV